jgi:hypothetical protein
LIGWVASINMQINNRQGLIADIIYCAHRGRVRGRLLPEPFVQRRHHERERL